MLMNPYFESTEAGDYAFAVEGTPLKFGPGVLAEVGEDAKNLGMTRVAVFTDPTVARLEPVATVVKSLHAAGMDAVIYNEVAVEPTDASFKAGARFAAEGRFDGFVSVGGGSVMDTCKASNLYATYPVDDFMVYVNAPIGASRPVPGPLKPHIACPTTFGTASECTTIAICDFLEMEVKSGIVSKRLRANLGVLDPTTLHTLPPMVIAANGFDVLTHAIESYTARPFTKRPKTVIPNQRPQAQGANPYSDIACLEAIRIAGRHLVQAVTDRSDRTVFEPLMFASMLAGIGFGNAGCHLAHGMSYAVSGLVRDYRAPGYPSDSPMVPHGISVIVNAPAVFRFTGPACPERHLQAAVALGADLHHTDPETAGCTIANRLTEMMRVTGIPNGLSGLGYGPDDIPALTEGAFPQKRLLDNAPLPVSKDQLANLFRDSILYW